MFCKAVVDRAKERGIEILAIQHSCAYDEGLAILNSIF